MVGTRHRAGSITPMSRCRWQPCRNLAVCVSWPATSLMRQGLPGRKFFPAAVSPRYRLPSRPDWAWLPWPGACCHWEPSRSVQNSTCRNCLPCRLSFTRECVTADRMMPSLRCLQLSGVLSKIETGLRHDCRPCAQPSPECLFRILFQIAWAGNREQLSGRLQTSAECPVCCKKNPQTQTFFVGSILRKLDWNLLPCAKTGREA